MFLVFFLVGKKKEKVEFVVLVWWIEWCVYDYEHDGCEKKGKFVGVTVGTSVGAKIGASVGAAIGYSVGASVKAT